MMADKSSKREANGCDPRHALNVGNMRPAGFVLVVDTVHFVDSTYICTGNGRVVTSYSWAKTVKSLRQSIVAPELLMFLSGIIENIDGQIHKVFIKSKEDSQ